MLGENACSGKTRIIIRSVSVSLTQLDASMLSVERSHLPHSECHVCVLWSFQRLVDDYCLLHPKHAQLVDDHSTLWYMKDQSSSEGRGGSVGGFNVRSGTHILEGNVPQGDVPIFRWAGGRWG